MLNYHNRMLYIIISSSVWTPFKSISMFWDLILLASKKLIFPALRHKYRKSSLKPVSTLWRQKLRELRKHKSISQNSLQLVQTRWSTEIGVTRATATVLSCLLPSHPRLSGTCIIMVFSLFLLSTFLSYIFF